MTTETPPAIPDPVIHDWSNDLEAELTESGMEPPQAKVFARAFELGMTRVLSAVATKQELFLTKQELQKAIDDLRQEFKQDLRDGLDRLRNELQREMEIRFQALEQIMLAKFEEAKQTRATERWLTRIAIAFIVAAQISQLLS